MTFWASSNIPINLYSCCISWMIYHVTLIKISDVWNGSWVLDEQTRINFTMTNFSRVQNMWYWWNISANWNIYHKANSPVFYDYNIMALSLVYVLHSYFRTENKTFIKIDYEFNCIRTEHDIEVINSNWILNLIKLWKLIWKLGSR